MCTKTRGLSAAGSSLQRILTVDYMSVFKIRPPIDSNTGLNVRLTLKLLLFFVFCDVTHVTVVKDGQ